MKIPVYQILGAGAIFGAVGALAYDQRIRRWAFVGAFTVPALLLGVNLLSAREARAGEKDPLGRKPSDEGRQLTATGEKPQPQQLSAIEETIGHWWLGDQEIPVNEEGLPDVPVTIGCSLRRLI